MRNTIEETALDAVGAGGTVLRDRFEAATTNVTAEFRDTDVEADADTAALVPVTGETHLASRGEGITCFFDSTRTGYSPGNLDISGA